MERCRGVEEEAYQICLPMGAFKSRSQGTQKVPLALVFLPKGKSLFEALNGGGLTCCHMSLKTMGLIPHSRKSEWKVCYMRQTHGSR